MKPERQEVADNALGFLDDTDGPTLHKYALECDGPFVELGSYAGKSTTWIGDAAEQRGTIVYAVDWHRGSPEMAPDGGCHHPEAIDPRTGRHDTLALFRQTIEAADLEGSVVAVAGRSQTVGGWWETPIGFLFIDACHGSEVGEDYDLWGKWVRPGGYLLFHDITINTIRAAADAALRDGFYEVEQVKTLLVLRRS